MFLTSLLPKPSTVITADLHQKRPASYEMSCKIKSKEGSLVRDLSVNLSHYPSYFLIIIVGINLIKYIFLNPMSKMFMSDNDGSQTTLPYGVRERERAGKNISIASTAAYCETQ